MNSRAIVIRVFIVLTVLILSVRLFYIQVADEQYKKAAEANIVHEIIEYPYRGHIYDRHKNLLVYNEPVFDLLILPREVNLEDSVNIKEILSISQEQFDRGYEKAKGFAKHLPSVFLEKIPKDEFAVIQDQLVNLKGFSIQPRTIRGYEFPLMSSVLGYVAEISRGQLARDTTRYYKSGDEIGINGIERQYENQLRGKRGKSFQTVNVQGMVMGKFGDGEYDSLPVPGEDIQLTIDLELQQYAEQLMKGKIGSLVAIEPSTGEILAFVSSPSYDPSLLRGRDYSKNYSVIQSDSLKPLFNRPLQAMYPPGSMFKTIQSLVAMQEKKLGPAEKIYCEGNLIGDLAPIGEYDVKKAITYSSNNFFYKVFRRIIQQGFDDNSYIDSRIGFEIWRNHLLNFGLGIKLGIDLPNENSGFVPSLATYDRVYGNNRWRFSNIYSLSIGQGEILVTPLQMANLGAILANRGYFITPHFLKNVEGDSSLVPREKRQVGIDQAYFPYVIDGMEQVVSMGSGLRAYIPDIAICGKTSTVQNPHGADHSGFMGFAPKENPKIAVAVYVENAGWGGRAAGSTASLVIEKYIRGNITRTWVEDYVLKGNFGDEKRASIESN
ncbi:MAG: penicillin-binding protein 2 [Cyclobacteriaceae bacterium]|nr:penicillin-binding protein 2 [Cyclobacteriaceae bacterium]